MPAIQVRENETLDYALRRFKRTCERAGVIFEARRREFYEKPAWIRKRKKTAALKRNQRRLRREQRMFMRKY